MKIKKVEIKQLDGKYYGTNVEITIINNSKEEQKFSINLWDTDDNEPSKRELKDWKSIEKFHKEICDSHFESEATYWLAKKIKKRLEDSESASEVKE